VTKEDYGEMFSILYEIHSEYYPRFLRNLPIIEIDKMLIRPFPMKKDIIIKPLLLNFSQGNLANPEILILMKLYTNIKGEGRDK